MDENFIVELAAEGEKKFLVEVPLGMSLGDALGKLKATMEEVIRASEKWKDKAGLKALIALEAEGWRGIFHKAQEVVTRDPQALVNTLGEDGNDQKLLDLAASGNKIMKHFHLQGQNTGDALAIYFLFELTPGPKFITTIDFG
jgi:hypothetical protein